MAEFVWRAAQASGQVVDGRLEAPSLAQALRQLRERGLTPLSVDDAAGVPGGALPAKAASALAGADRPARAQKGPVKAADVLAITSELAIMLKAGLALDNALRVLIEMSHKPTVAALLQGILSDVKGGAPLSRALTQHKALFGDFYINMVRSGEASGQMASVMARLVEHMERLRALRDSVVSATIYPAILLGVAVLSLVAMLGFVVPQFEQLFKDMGDALPLPTRIVMEMGQTFQAYGWAIALVAAALFWLIGRWLKTPGGSQWWQTRVLRLPLLGGLLRKYQLTLFARSLGTLLGNGVPLLTALRIATETVGNQTLRGPLERMVPQVKEGARVADAMRNTGIFEPLALNLMRVGEETGRIGPMMLELAQILNREVENGIKRALTMLEPLLILVLGVLIASIIVSILLGILSVNDLAV
ncbi:MAG: type II secretion system F family protein [Hydrogenophaga sp.]|nr:type II secretion system F family protein [Hydrogenophaga sp.]